MTTKQNQTLVLLILLSSFFLETVLNGALYSVLPFGIYYLLSNVFYLALFACFLIMSKPNLNQSAVLKSACLALGFFVFESVLTYVLPIISVFVIAYEVLRPFCILALVILACKWIYKIRFSFNQSSLLTLCVAFAFSALFVVLSYYETLASLLNVGDNLFSYFKLLSSPSSIFSLLGKLCTYIITNTLLVRVNALKS